MRGSFMQSFVVSANKATSRTSRMLSTGDSWYLRDRMQDRTSCASASKLLWNKVFNESTSHNALGWDPSMAAFGWRAGIRGRLRTTF